LGGWLSDIACDRIYEVYGRQLQVSSITWEKTVLRTMVKLIQPCGFQIDKNLILRCFAFSLWDVHACSNEYSSF
jgi:hypothetical protein